MTPGSVASPHSTLIWHYAISVTGLIAGGQALCQVVDLSLGVPAEPPVDGEKLLQGRVRVAVGVVVHVFQWTRPWLIAQANQKVALFDTAGSDVI